MDPPKRRLPVLNRASDEDEGPTRPPWQWVAFGVLAIFAAWVPLTALVTATAGFMASRTVSGERAAALGAAVAGLYLAALALGALLGGLLVGRWGPPSVGTREAALAGLGAALAAGAASWLTIGPSPGWLLLAAAALPAAALGGRLGVRLRTAARAQR
jgi:hypothetical protein